MLSLPRCCGTTSNSIPGQTPYLKAPGRKQLPHGPAGLKVGFVWKGSPKHHRTRFRDIPLEQWAPLMTVPGVTFYSLQVGAGAEEIQSFPFPVVDLAPEISGFLDAADFLDQLDLLISVDTAYVHLRGALHRPVWVLLPFCPDWRWMLERTDSPWYPTVRLYRQPKPLEWSSVMRQVQTDLLELARGSEA